MWVPYPCLFYLFIEIFSILSLKKKGWIEIKIKHFNLTSGHLNLNVHINRICKRRGFITVVLHQWALQLINSLKTEKK